MKPIVKRHFWIVNAAGLALAVGLAASAITTQLGTSVLIEDAKAVEPSRDDEGEDDKGKRKRSGASTFRELTSSASAKRQTAEGVMAHNIFCPTCLPPTEEAKPPPPPPPTGPLAGRIAAGEIESKLNLRVVATLEAEDPTHSFATIYDGDAGITGLYGRGDAIRAQVVVEAIDRGLVHLRNATQLEYLEVGEGAEPKKSKSSSKKRKSKKKKRKNKRAIPGADEAIDCPNKNLCTVERASVDKVVGNPAMLAKQARVVPSRKDGKTRGYKLYGIRRGTLPKLLGLKNGDMITEINGESLTSIDKVMGLYTKLRRASRLEVEIVRRGKSMTKEIQID